MAYLQGEVGMKLEEGQQVYTNSGRLTDEFPRVDCTTNGKAANTIKRVNKWLLDCAKLEASAKNDWFCTIQFAAMDLKNLSPADKDSLELYLFG